MIAKEEHMRHCFACRFDGDPFKNEEILEEYRNKILEELKPAIIENRRRTLESVREMCERRNEEMMKERFLRSEDHETEEVKKMPQEPLFMGYDIPKIIAEAKHRTLESVREMVEGMKIKNIGNGTEAMFNDTYNEVLDAVIEGLRKI